jgi:hypothetical protein
VVICLREEKEREENFVMIVGLNPTKSIKRKTTKE